MIVPPCRGVGRRSTSQSNSKKSQFRVLRTKSPSPISIGPRSTPRVPSLHFSREPSVVASMAVSLNREPRLDE
jgi:hypothetical protein